MKLIPYMNTDNPRIAVARFFCCLMFLIGLVFTLLDGFQTIDIVLILGCIYGMLNLSLHLWECHDMVDE
jgi:hypothetical protein